MSIHSDTSMYHDIPCIDTNQYSITATIWQYVLLKALPPVCMKYTESHVFCDEKCQRATVL